MKKIILISLLTISAMAANVLPTETRSKTVQNDSPLSLIWEKRKVVGLNYATGEDEYKPNSGTTITEYDSVSYTVGLGYRTNLFNASLSYSIQNEDVSVSGSHTAEFEVRSLSFEFGYFL